MMKKNTIKYSFLLIIGLLFFADIASAQKASWIWYPGDYEVWLSNKMQNRRTERGTFMPPFWKLDSHFILMNFRKDFVLPDAEDVHFYADGVYNINLDGQKIHGKPQTLHIPAGKHRLTIKIYSRANVCGIY